MASSRKQVERQGAPKMSQRPPPPKKVYVGSPTSLLFRTSPFPVFFTWQKSGREKWDFWKREGTKKTEEVSERRHGFSFILSGERAFCVREPHAGVLIRGCPGRRVVLFLISTHVALCFVWCHQRDRERSYVCRWKPDWAQRAAERRTPQRQSPSTRSHLRDNKSAQTAVGDTSDTLQSRHEVITATKSSSSCCGQRKPQSVLPSHTADEETAGVVTVGCDAAGGTETEGAHGRCRLS